MCVLLQDLVQSCLRGEGGILEDMCYERRRAEACVDWGAREEPGTLTQGGGLFSLVCCFITHVCVFIMCVCLLLQYLLQSCVCVCLLLQYRVCVYYCSTYYKAVRDWDP